MVKLPWPPPAATLAGQIPEIGTVEPHTVLWRVHETVGPHVLDWNQLRHFGPVADCRFDPQPPPPGPGNPEGVLYAAVDLPTTLAERFQTTRTVDRRRGSPALVAWHPTRPLQLLDLTGDWPVRLGASHVINTGRRDVCRAWARALRAAWPDADGLRHTSSMTGHPGVTLWTPAANSFPARPDFSELLAHPGLATWLAAACRTVGYRML